MSKGSRIALLFGLLMVAADGRAGDPEPTFDGKTAPQWPEQLKDKDPGVARLADTTIKRIQAGN